MAFAFAATHGGALVMMALADVLTRLVGVYLRGRRLAAGSAAASALIRPTPVPDLVSEPAAGQAVSRKARPAAAGLIHGTSLQKSPAPIRERRHAARDLIRPVWIPSCTRLAPCT